MRMCGEGRFDLGRVDVAPTDGEHVDPTDRQVEEALAAVVDVPPEVAERVPTVPTPGVDAGATPRTTSVAALLGEDPARVVHQHGDELLIGHAALLQSRDDVVVDVQVVPVGQGDGQGRLRKSVEVAGRVV